MCVKVVGTGGIDPCHSWPAMVWGWLSNAEMVSTVGLQCWEIVPSLWRSWWIDEFQKLSSDHASVTVDYPASVVIDATPTSTALQGTPLRLKLGELMEACDEYLMLAVKCLWGCSEFYTRAKMLELIWWYQKIWAWCDWEISFGVKWYG